jgi:hypothetical protein
MDALPAELQALILTADFATWTAAVQTLGRITVQPYVQSYARRRFLRSHVNSIGVINYLLMDDMSARHGKSEVIYYKYIHNPGSGIPISRPTPDDMKVVTCTQWYFKGKLHNEHHPADVYKMGKELLIIQWYWNGKLHRPYSDMNGGPATTIVHGCEYHEYWYEHGELLKCAIKTD